MIDFRQTNLCDMFSKSLDLSSAELPAETVVHSDGNVL